MEKAVTTFDNFEVFQYKINKVGTYYISVPTGDVDKYDMFIGFPNKDLSQLSDNEIVSEFSRTAEMVTSLYNGIYVMPMIPYDKLVDAMNENDDRLFSEIWWDIVTPITTEIYIRLNGKFNNKRNFIIRVDSDRKLIDWIEIECSKFGKNLIEEFEYSDLINRYSKNKIIDNEILDNSSTQQMNSEIVSVEFKLDSVSSQNKPYTRNLKPKNPSSGFSSFKFIIVTILVSLVAGIGLGYLLIK